VKRVKINSAVRPLGRKVSTCDSHRPCVAQERVQRVKALPQVSLHMVHGVDQFRVHLDLSAACK
jgi:hypothetical protein